MALAGPTIMAVKTRRNVSMKAKAMEVCIVGLCAAFAVCACVALNGHAIAGEENMRGFEDYLSEMGNRLDCYFTVESIGHTEMVYPPNGNPFRAPVYGNPILNGTVNVGSEDAKSINAMVSFLNKVSIEWGPAQKIRLVAEKIERNKTIIRIRDARLSDVAGYVLNTKVSIEYNGIPNGLLTLLSTQDPLIRPRNFVSTVGDIGIDINTPVRVAVKDTPIRNLLTDCIPLSEYSRIIWGSFTNGKAESPVVTVEFYGRSME
jgi:hypothetical protein